MRTAGTQKNEPIVEETTSGSYRSTPCPVRISPSTPSASQERRIVPRLPWFEGRSNSAISGFSESGMREKSSSRILTTASSSEVSALPLSAASRSPRSVVDLRAHRGELVLAQSESFRSPS